MNSQACLSCKGVIGSRPEELALRAKLAPVIGGKKYELPSPTLCFNCRMQRRMMWRNDRNLYERVCDKSGQKLISMFNPETEATVWHKDLWWADDWDAKEYGVDFDFNRGFFDQYKDLLARAPMPHVMTLNSENSLYTNYNADNKNCYLCFAGNYLEDSLYCYNAQNSKDCVDCYFVLNCELCYECVECSDSYNLKYSLHSKNCRDSAFLEDCSNCSDCFMSWNLRGKQYCFMNKQYSKEEYEKLMSEIDLNDYQTVADLWNKWRLMSFEQIKPQFHNISAENCTGDYINGAKNCTACYMISPGTEDCCYVLNSFPNLKDALDCTYCGENAELIYESLASGQNANAIYFSHIAVDGSANLFYCNVTFSSKDCFGCTGLRNSQYCILNKQYTKEEYFALVPKIIEFMKQKGEWGEFPPADTSFFGYNQTLAQDYFPLTKEEALKKGYKWYEAVNKSAVAQGATAAQGVGLAPNDALVCEKSGRSFKTTPAELVFYKKLGIPLPHLHPDERHIRRTHLKTPYKFGSRNCGNCQKPISTAYSPERAKTVYCEDCYLKEIY